MFRRLSVLFFAVLIAVPVIADDVPAAPTPKTVKATAEMGKLAFLLGEWKGKGWMEGPDGRHDFPQSKIVTGYMDNLVLGIEGDSMTSGNVFYRHTLVMVSYDGKHPYRIHAYGGADAVVDGDAAIKDGAFVWGFALGKMKLRYQISVNDKNQWVEVGDRSMDDGATWHKFTELVLDKVR